MGPLAILHVLYSSALATHGEYAIGADIMLKGPYGITLLGTAAHLGHTELVKVLLADERVDPAAGCNSALRLAVQNNRPGCVQALLDDKRVSPDDPDNLAICHAAEKGHARCVELLLAHPRVNPANGHMHAITKAAENGHTRCVELLLAHPRVNPAANDDYAICKAAYNGHTECVGLLLAHPRVNPAAKNNYAVRYAAYNGHTGCVKLLLADVRVHPGDIRNLAIRHAAQRGHEGCVRLLLADPRVDPGAVSQASCSPEIGALIGRIQAFQDGDLKAFKDMCLLDLTDDVLDILISRNRSFPEVQGYLFRVQLAYLGVPRIVRDHPLYKALVDLVRSNGVWETGQVREVIKTLLQDSTEPPSE